MFNENGSEDSFDEMMNCKEDKRNECVSVILYKLVVFEILIKRPQYAYGALHLETEY